MSCGQVIRKWTSLVSRDRRARHAVAPLGIVIVLVMAVPAAAEPSAPLTITFDATTTTIGWHSGQASGTFTAAGALTDAGTVRLSYRLSAGRVDATATLMGAKGILTIGQRGTLTAMLDARQSAAGVWRTCGGTGAYRRFGGHGSWEAVVDELASPAGTVPHNFHGSYVGLGHRRPARRPRSSFLTGDPWC
jgi:hypothetical protein